MKIKASAEDYLEAILVLNKTNPHIRAVDIAQHMGYSKPSISNVLKQFRENGYITIDNDRNISLTDKGAKIANRTYERHMIISRFLCAIGVSEDVALEDACRLEHGLSDESFECLSDYYNKIIEENHTQKNNHQGEETFPDGFY